MARETEKRECLELEALENEDTCGLLEDYGTEVSSGDLSLERQIMIAIVKMTGVRIRYMEKDRCLGTYKIDLVRLLNAYSIVRDEYFELSYKQAVARGYSVSREEHVAKISKELTALEERAQKRLDKIKPIDKDLWFSYQEEVEDLYRSYACKNDGVSFEGVRRRKRLSLKDAMMGRKLRK